MVVSPSERCQTVRASSDVDARRRRRRRRREATRFADSTWWTSARDSVTTIRAGLATKKAMPRKHLLRAEVDDPEVGQQGPHGDDDGDRGETVEDSLHPDRLGGRGTAPAPRVSRTEASSIVPGTVGIFPSAISRIVLRRILPDRVLGRAATTSTRCSDAIAPTSSRTRCFSSARIRSPSAAPSTPALSTTSARGTCPLRSSCDADHRALGHGGVPGQRRLDRAGRQPVARRR